MRTQCLLFTGEGRVAPDTLELPAPGPGEALVRIAHSCVSPGTETRCLAGRQNGAPPWPYVPGYSASGTVEAVGEGAALPVGTRVYCPGTACGDRALMWGAHAAHAVRDARDLVPVPPGVSLRDASAAHLAAIAHRGLALAGTAPGEDVAVLGLGVVGQLAARLHAAAGGVTVAGDTDAERVALAEEAGLRAVHVDPREPAAAFAALQPEGADVVVDATGVPAVLPHALALARGLPWDTDADAAHGARLVVQGSHTGALAVPYEAAFTKEVGIHVPRDARRTDLVAVLDLMAAGALHLTDLLGVPARPEDAPHAYRALTDRPRPTTTVFDWHGESG